MKRINVKLIVLICSGVLFSGCAYTKVKRYSDFDSNEKSIAIPLKDGMEFIADVKDYFNERGFKVITYGGGRARTQFNQSQSLTRNQHQARYDLNFTSTI